MLSTLTPLSSPPKREIYISGDNTYLWIGSDCVADEDMHIVIESSCKFNISDDVRLGMANIYIGSGSMFRVGDRTGFSGLIHLNPVKAIEIGTDCPIASGVWMSTSDFHSIIGGNGGARLNLAKPFARATMSGSPSRRRSSRVRPAATMRSSGRTRSSPETYPTIAWPPATARPSCTRMSPDRQT